MLVLSRKNDQSIVIQAPGGRGQTVTVTLLETARGGAKLGFEANRDVLVHREEVWERIRTKGGLGGSQSEPVPPREALDRWEDDGGGPIAPTVGRGVHESNPPIAGTSSPPGDSCSAPTSSPGLPEMKGRDICRDGDQVKGGAD
jgi:carbon storage regulator CsrA